MFTTFINSDNKKVKCITKQYEIGTYVAFYNENGFDGQCTSNLSERDFHIKLRKEILKNKQRLIDGTILNYKSKKHLLDKFENEDN